MYDEEERYDFDQPEIQDLGDSFGVVTNTEKETWIMQDGLEAARTYDEEA